jgi:hypothetical protein
VEQILDSDRGSVKRLSLQQKSRNCCTITKELGFGLVRLELENSSDLAEIWLPSEKNLWVLS